MKLGTGQGGKIVGAQPARIGDRPTEAAEKMARMTGDRALLDLTQAVEETTVRVLHEVKPGRDLYANVELYAAIILHWIDGMGG